MIGRGFALLLCTPLLAQATRPTGVPPYRRHDLAKALVKRDAGGKPAYELDLAAVAAAVEDLARHARNYPPQFRDAGDRAAATQEARSLSEALVVITGAQDREPPADVLLLAARLESLGHNLEIEGSAGRATACFERLLAREPENARANLHYGVFLAGTATGQKQGLPYLEKALRLGEEDARYALGMAHLVLRDTARALEHLEEFARLHPGDLRTQRLIDAIKNGRIEGPAASAQSRPGSARRPASRPASGAQDR
jgi:tetratricopeptide (TPR) repeat protein